MASLVLPVVCADGTAAALKLQPLDEENAGEPIGLRAWDGDGAVRLLDHDPTTGAMLLGRLDATRPLSTVADTLALQILAELLARLVAVPAPHGLRSLAGIAAAMLDQVPHVVPMLRDPADQRLVRSCASAVTELISEPGDRLLSGTCTTTTSSPGSASHGWRSTRSRLPATPVSSCCRRWTTGGRRWWQPAT
jgi:streptomycin 6-kinase